MSESDQMVVIPGVFVNNGMIVPVVTSIPRPTEDHRSQESDCTNDHQNDSDGVDVKSVGVLDMDSPCKNSSNSKKEDAYPITHYKSPPDPTASPKSHAMNNTNATIHKNLNMNPSPPNSRASNSNISNHPMVPPYPHLGGFTPNV